MTLIGPFDRNPCPYLPAETGCPKPGHGLPGVPDKRSLRRDRLAPPEVTFEGLVTNSAAKPLRRLSTACPTDIAHPLPEPINRLTPYIYRREPLGQPPLFLLLGRDQLRNHLISGKKRLPAITKVALT